MATVTWVLSLLPDNLIKMLDIPSKSTEFLMEIIGIIGIVLFAAVWARDLEAKSKEMDYGIVLFGAWQVG